MGVFLGQKQKKVENSLSVDQLNAQALTRYHDYVNRKAEENGISPEEYARQWNERSAKNTAFIRDTGWELLEMESKGQELEERSENGFRFRFERDMLDPFEADFDLAR